MIRACPMCLAFNSIASGLSNYFSILPMHQVGTKWMVETSKLDKSESRINQSKLVFKAFKVFRS